MILSLLNLLRFILWSCIWSTSGTVPCTLMMMGAKFDKCQLNQVGSIVWVFYIVSNFLFIVSVTEKEVRTSPIIIMDLPISSCNSIGFCFAYFESSAVRWIHIWHCYVPLLNWPLYHYMVSLFISGNASFNEVYFADNIVTPAFF